MQFENLRVFHLSKKKDSPLDPDLRALAASVSSGFWMDTCQRWIWVVDAQVCDISEVCVRFPFVEAYAGDRAYLFLLRLASGLESEILGETDIFGQMKEAWRTSFETTRLSSSFFPALMSRLFEDTKEIRSRYIQNWGGASYGSLVRKLIRDHAQKENVPVGPIFLVGAGQIAHSVAPFLVDAELWVWNRNPQRLMGLKTELSQKLTTSDFGKIHFLSSEEHAQHAWRQARHAVLAVPAEEKEDRARIGLWLEGGLAGRSVTHLGGHRKECSSWVQTCSDRFFALDDLFAVQKNLDQLRMVQVQRAIRACEERVKLRALGDSLSIPHGWEDLACFA